MTKKIMVCDDDESVSEMVKIMLESGGYEVLSISTGKGIQKTIKEYQPALILIDLWMPGMDGKEVITLLKRDQSTKNIPIVIISALSEGEINKIVKKTQAQGFLSKPFNMEDLLNLAQKHTSD